MLDGVRDVEQATSADGNGLPHHAGDSLEAVVPGHSVVFEMIRVREVDQSSSALHARTRRRFSVHEGLRRRDEEHSPCSASATILSDLACLAQRCSPWCWYLTNSAPSLASEYRKDYECFGREVIEL